MNSLPAESADLALIESASPGPRRIPKILVGCPACGAAIYRETENCSRCGRILHPTEGRAWQRLSLILAVMSMMATIAGFAMIVYFGG